MENDMMKSAQEQMMVAIRQQEDPQVTALKLQLELPQKQFLCWMRHQELVKKEGKSRRKYEPRYQSKNRSELETILLVLRMLWTLG